eukprot:10075242-Alexandrium_andersonii.AAC.1
MDARAAVAALLGGACAHAAPQPGGRSSWGRGNSCSPADQAVRVRRSADSPMGSRAPITIDIPLRSA